MKIEDIGEFELIEIIRNTIGETPNLLLGIGDDACAWTFHAGIHLATTDSLVEGIHFNPKLARWYDLGYKALAVNLSDIAAMGGLGSIALVSLALPGDIQVEDIVSFYQGMLELARESEVSIGGGNISRSPLISITVSLIGTGSVAGMLKRSGARKGDLVAITGFPGSAAAGRTVLYNPCTPDGEYTTPLVQSFIKPVPRLAQGHVLKNEGASSAIDISDGLLADLGHLLTASGLGATIDVDKLPLEPLIKSGFSLKQAAELALSGGEDYELLFTASKNAMKNIAKEIGVQMSIIGRITEAPPGHIELTGENASLVNLNTAGWKHFG